MRPTAPRHQERLYHDWLLPEETRQVRKEARAFVNKQVLPVADELNTTPESISAFPWTLFHAMASLHMYGIPFPAKEGGRGLKYPLCAATVVMEELAYASDGLAAIYDDHCLLPGVALMHGSDETRKGYLRPL
ncbi:MAG TPA: acyl-CoA dehydrogenase family protein, partial [Dehalococcoidia bacterium]|nr:acyl-CoA dehydrogenase family protein [Dehalococcoidia bacterium]